jgi:S1-C subfamily serine protease
MKEGTMSKRSAINTLQEMQAPHELYRDDAAAYELEHYDRVSVRRYTAVLHVMWMALAVALALSAMCCVHGPVRSIADEHESTVLIVQACTVGPSGAGTGVITSKRTILTAGHVVDSPCFMTATVGGKPYAFVVTRLWKDRDVAELTTFVDLPYVPVSIGPPLAPGEYAFVVAAMPRPLRKQGMVQYYRPEKPLDHIVIDDVVIEPGNSGSGVYDKHGRLVGILTRYGTCINGQYCDGQYSSLEFLR